MQMCPHVKAQQHLKDDMKASAALELTCVSYLMYVSKVIWHDLNAFTIFLVLIKLENQQRQFFKNDLLRKLKTLMLKQKANKLHISHIYAFWIILIYLVFDQQNLFRPRYVCCWLMITDNILKPFITTFHVLVFSFFLITLCTVTWNCFMGSSAERMFQLSGKLSESLNPVESLWGCWRGNGPLQLRGRVVGCRLAIYETCASL